MQHGNNNILLQCSRSKTKIGSEQPETKKMNLLQL